MSGCPIRHLLPVPTHLDRSSDIPVGTIIISPVCHSRENGNPAISRSIVVQILPDSVVTGIVLIFLSSKLFAGSSVLIPSKKGSIYSGL
jgi:hypothetical protein